MAGVLTVKSTSTTCHGSSNCRASGTGGLRLKAQVKVGREVGM